MATSECFWAPGLLHIFIQGTQDLLKPASATKLWGALPEPKGQGSHPLGPSQAGGRGQQEPHEDKHKVLSKGKKGQQGKLGQLCCKEPGNLGGQQLNLRQQCALAPKASWAARAGPQDPARRLVSTHCTSPPFCVLAQVLKYNEDMKKQG